MALQLASISTEINNALVLCLAPLKALAVDAIINPTDTALSHGEAASLVKLVLRLAQALLRSVYAMASCSWAMR